MSSLYDIYAHPSRGVWGVCASDGHVRTALICGGELRELQLKPSEFAAAVSQKVRCGFVRAKRPQYLRLTKKDGRTVCEFVDRHPDLTRYERAPVLYTTLSSADDKKEISKSFELKLDATECRSDDVTSWLLGIGESSDYIAASHHHPAIPLVLADWAISQRRPLLSDHDGLPPMLPRENPSNWAEWLGNHFAIRQIQVAQQQLGWASREIDKFASVSQEPVKPEQWFSNSALITF